MRSPNAWTCTAIFGALLGVGCGPAPYALGPDEPAFADPPAPGVYVLVGSQAAAPAPATPPEDRWIPDGFPRPNPFAETRTWIGAFDCPPGRTRLAFRVIDVHDKRVRALFDFHHAQSGASGQYLVAGAFDEQTGVAVFAPGRWLNRPDGFMAVGLRGRISPDGTRFSGNVTEPGCGGFQLRAAR